MSTKILLVEDNELNRDMLLRRLQKRGYEVVVAENGEQAIKLATSEMPTLILMDMSLPIIDGWEATKQIKAKQNTPIIALTAYAMKGDKDKALAAGCDDYDTKPVDIERLISKIEAFIHKE